MNRIKNLYTYQKGILILLVVLMALFAVIYHMVISREGILYEDAIFVPMVENGATIYTGRLNGQKSTFTVTEDKTVTFRYGEKVYGPYTVKEDVTAIPEDHEYSKAMTGIEIRKGNTLLFRGGILRNRGAGSYWILVSEDGDETPSYNVEILTGDTLVDANGNVIDPMEPSLKNILNLVYGPELTHKGHWGLWFVGVFFSVVTTIPMLFCEELYRWRLSYWVRNAEQAEPSDFAIAGMHIGWMVIPVGAIVFYIMGLRV